MNVIIAYLETMFSAYPRTPRLIEAKTELQSMMEDAYTSLIAEGRSENEAVGQVIRDFGNIEEVAPALGIASDIAPAPDAAASTSTSTDAAPRHPPVTLEEAQGYADAQQRVRFRVSTAVVLFVLSPAVLIALSSAAGSGVLPIARTTAVFVGIVALLVSVAAGVMLIVTASRETAPYRRIAEGRFTASAVVGRWAEEVAARHERGRIRALQIAVGLWILAPVPLIGFALLLDDPRGGFWVAIGVVLVLVVVAAGLGVLLPQTWARTVAESVGRGAKATTSGDDAEHSLIGAIAAIYWPLLTTIFLAWGFIGQAWGTAWIVWPIGAVLFGAIAGVGGLVGSQRRAR